MRHVVEAVAVAPGRQARSTSWVDFVELTKPRLTALVVVVAVAGAWIAAPGAVQLALLLHLAAGMGLVVGGANALNMVIERDLDARMERTRSRPLPAGRLGAAGAACFGIAAAAVGAVWLAWATTPAAAVVAVTSFALYVGVYTPLKRTTTLNTQVGAISGALPAVIGWAAVRGTVEVHGWLLFAILYLWQIPHFLAIAWMYREDYRRGGFCMLPRMDASGAATARQAVVAALVLLPVSLVPTSAGLAGPLYFVAAAALGTLYLRAALRFWRASEQRDAAARSLMRVSLFYLPLLLLFLLADAGSL